MSQATTSTWGVAAGLGAHHGHGAGGAGLACSGVIGNVRPALDAAFPLDMDVNNMTGQKVLLVTGASRGMGVDIAKAAWPPGTRWSRPAGTPQKVERAVGAAEDLLTVRLDVTDPTGAQAAVQAAADRFGHIDVLVNNAGNFIAGFFRTDLLTSESTSYAEASIDDYADRTKQAVTAWSGMNGAYRELSSALAHDA